MRLIATLLLAITLYAAPAVAQDSTVYVSLGTPKAAGSIYIDGYGWQPKWLIPVNVSNPSGRDFEGFGAGPPDPLGRSVPNLRSTGNLRVLHGWGVTPGYEDPTVHGTFWPWMGASVQEMWPIENDSDHELSFAGWYNFNDPCGFNPTGGWMLDFPVWGTYGTLQLLSATSKANDCQNVINLPLSVGPLVNVPPDDLPPGGGGGEGGGCCHEDPVTVEREGAPKEVKAKPRTTWGTIKKFYR